MHEQWSAYKAASELLARGDDAVLRYVALELRVCIEAVVYEKLSAYRDGLPLDAKTWQPPQAFKALLNFEPDADQTLTIAVARQTRFDVPAGGPFTVLGTDHRPSARWLTKTWNKLGRYLHAEWPFGEKRLNDPSRTFLENVLKTLSPFVDARAVTAAFSGPQQTFDCVACGAACRVSQAVLDSHCEVYCVKCEARYSVTHGEDGYYFKLTEDAVECPGCAAQIVLPIRAALRPNHSVKCRKCAGQYSVTVRQLQCNIDLSPLDRSQTKKDNGDV
jgi:hypothetical protein